MTTVFIVHHVHVISAEEDIENVKLIGVYSTEGLARAAVRRLSVQPGFRDHIDGFSVVEHLLDKDEWTEGFISWSEALEPSDDADA